MAALGGEVLIDTVDGRVVYDVKAGTQTDTRVRLRGKGVPSLRNKDIRGDHYVTLVVQVPERLSSEAKSFCASLMRRLETAWKQSRTWRKAIQATRGTKKKRNADFSKNKKV